MIEPFIDEPPPEGLDGGLDGGEIRILQAGDVLIRRGEARSHLFLVEMGTIALFRSRPQGDQSAVELTFAGDVVGLGFLAHHAFWAVAVRTSRVRLLPLRAHERLMRSSVRTKERYEAAVEREFLARRDELTKAFRDDPTRRVAAFLLAVSELNAHEGRDPSLIGDALSSGTVANYLDLDLETLRGALVALSDMLLVEHCPPSGLRLKNLAGLRALAKEAPLAR